MGMTQTQKILAAHAGLAEVKAGQLINAKLDIVLGNDITTPVAINEFEKAGFNGVFDKEHIAIVLDHFVPNKDIKSATQSKQCREFANKYDILNFYDVGQMGIEHALLPEKGIVTAGDCVIGADSHTCTYGALGAFSTGVGSTDMAAGMATGMAWFKVPAAIKFVLNGKLPPKVSGKDLILHIIGMIGVDGALYKSMEFTGPGVASLSMDDRLSICNMAIEAGAKNGIFPVDDVTKAYLKGRSQREPVFYEADPDAEYEKTIEIDLSALEPTVSYPHLPENTHPASEGKDIKIDQVVIGSCTNGRLGRQVFCSCLSKLFFLPGNFSKEGIKFTVRLHMKLDLLLSLLQRNRCLYTLCISCGQTKLSPADPICLCQIQIIMMILTQIEGYSCLRRISSYRHIQCCIKFRLAYTEEGWRIHIIQREMIAPKFRPLLCKLIIRLIICSQMTPSETVCSQLLKRNIIAGILAGSIEIHFHLSLHLTVHTGSKPSVLLPLYRYQKYLSPQMVERHPHSLLAEAETYDKCRTILCLYQIAMTNSLNAALVTAKITVCHNRIQRI